MNIVNDSVLEALVKKVDRELYIRLTHAYLVARQTIQLIEADKEDVRKIPKGINAHVICYWLASLYPGLKVVHGTFHGLAPHSSGNFVTTAGPHSWLVTPTGECIIDPRPYGVLTLAPHLIPINVPTGLHNDGIFAACQYREANIDEHFNLRDTLDVAAELKAFLGERKGKIVEAIHRTPVSTG